MMVANNDSENYPDLTMETLHAVDAFARDMKRKLNDNAYKGQRDNWVKDKPAQLYDRLREEAIELRNAMYVQIDPTAYEEQLQRIIDEAADVGNFAMMIADKVRDALVRHHQLAQREQAKKDE